MNDMKYEMQMIAEDLAETEFLKDYYDLPIDKQIELYGRATAIWMERQLDRADYLRKAARENP